jgi:hypothetical protein
MNAKSHADLGRGKSTPAQRDAECPTSDEKFKMDLKKSQKAQDAYAAPGSAPQGRPPTPVVCGQGKLEGGKKRGEKVSPTPYQKLSARLD